MSEKNYAEIINLYIDGELDKSMESAMFSILASNSEAREYFKSLQKIKNAVEKTTEDFPSELEERIFRNLKNEKKVSESFLGNYNIKNFISYAAAVIFLFISGYLFLKISSYQERFESVSQQIILQSKTIEMLYNSYENIEVNAKLDNQIIIKPSI
jgi:hypothetical protein